jgi:hypothetical protein
MANRDTPFGFVPITPDAPCHEYTATTSTTIYKGDVLKFVTAGTVEVAAAGDDTIILGVAAEHVTTAAAGAKIMVYDDPETEYVIQGETGWSSSQADVFGTSDTCTYLAGNSVTHNSYLELADPAGSSANWLLLRLWDSPDNAWGEHAKVVVKINQGVRQTAYAGLT